MCRQTAAVTARLGVTARRPSCGARLAISRASTGGTWNAPIDNCFAPHAISQRERADRSPHRNGSPPHRYGPALTSKRRSDFSGQTRSRRSSASMTSTYSSVVCAQPTACLPQPRRCEPASPWASRSPPSFAILSAMMTRWRGSGMRQSRFSASLGLHRRSYAATRCGSQPRSNVGWRRERASSPGLNQPCVSEWRTSHMSPQELPVASRDGL